MNPKERAWGANKGIMTEEAKHRYIEHIDSRNLGWSKATASAGEYGTIEGGMGLCPSTLSRGNETPSTPFEIYYEAIRMGDMKIIANFVNTDPVLAATRDSTGGSAMHWAADAGRHELIPILKDAGFQVNDIDNEHQTPLHLGLFLNFFNNLCICNFLAAICEHVFTVKELLENGAYPYYKDDDGMTAMELIMESPLLASLPRFVGHSFNEKTVLTSW